MPPKDLDEYIWWLMDQTPELEKTPKDVKINELVHLNSKTRTTQAII